MLAFYHLFGLQPGETVDATIMRTGQRVAIKRLRNSLDELRILRFISEGPHIHDPRNHAVTLLDTFVDHIDSKVTFVVIAPPSPI